MCENNLYGISVSIKKTCCIENIADRAKGYAIPGHVVDGMDVLSVEDTALKAIQRARSGKGPTLIECKTYRFLGHSRGDPMFGPYRCKEEWESWKKRDPIPALINQLKLPESEIADIDREVNEVIERAVTFAENSPYPEPETVSENLFA